MKCFPVQKLRKKFNGTVEEEVVEESQHAVLDQAAPVAYGTSLRGKVFVRSMQNAQWSANGNRKLRSSHPTYGSRKARKDALETSQSLLTLGRRARSITEAGSTFFNFSAICHTCKHLDATVPYVPSVAAAASASPFTDDSNTKLPFLQPLPSPQTTHLLHKVSQSSAYRLPLPSENAYNTKSCSSSQVNSTTLFPLMANNVNTALKLVPASSSSLLSTATPCNRLHQLQMNDSSGLPVSISQNKYSNGLVSSSTPARDILVHSRSPTSEIQHPPSPSEGMLATSTLKCFKYDEVLSACQNFSLHCRLADLDNCFNGTIQVEGSWKGRKQHEVLILRLQESQPQEMNEWIMKLSMVAQACHASSHVCQLLGFCREGWDSDRILVYERLKRGSLFTLLFGTKSTPSLDWAVRMKIAYGAAQGLAILHEKFPNTVLYGDFRACSVQVDHVYNSKVSLYAILDPLNFEMQTRSSNPRVNAYKAPETLSHGELTLKSNVWSFGIILLELLSGKQHFNEEVSKHQRQNLVKWAEPYLADESKIFLLMDPNLKGSFPLGRAKLVASLILHCLQIDPTNRPTMQEALGVIQDVRGLRSSKSRESENITKAFTSASPVSVAASLSSHRRQLNGIIPSQLDIFEGPLLRPLIIPPRCCGDDRHQHCGQDYMPIV